MSQFYATLVLQWGVHCIQNNLKCRRLECVRIWYFSHKIQLGWTLSLKPRHSCLFHLTVCGFHFQPCLAVLSDCWRFNSHIYSESTWTEKQGKEKQTQVKNLKKKLPSIWSLPISQKSASASRPIYNLGTGQGLGIQRHVAERIQWDTEDLGHWRMMGRRTLMGN